VCVYNVCGPGFNLPTLKKEENRPRFFLKVLLIPPRWDLASLPAVIHVDRRKGAVDIHIGSWPIV
jgi:hypothetical protein